MPNDTVLSSFTITAKTRSFQLDPQGKGVCNFIIANSGKAALEGRVRLTPTGQNPAVAEWLTITEPAEQAYKPNEERTYSVNITVPPDAPGGTYLFRAEAYSVANPNDDYVGGPEFSFTIMRDAPSQPSKGFPLWIPFTALALVVAIAALVAVFVMMGGDSAPKEATLVSVVGLPETEAQQKLVELGLEVKSTIERTDQVPEGQVISQDPALNAEDATKNVLALPNLVMLTVAAKPDTPMAKVPSVTGLTIEAAQKAITDAGLVMGVIGEKDEGAGAPGLVLQQSPDHSTQQVAGSAVSLTVKAKPAPVGPAVPSWTGSMRVRVGILADVDTGKESSDPKVIGTSDFIFLARTASERTLLAQKGVSFGFPTEATLAACSEAIRLAPATSIDLTQIKIGKLIAIRTNSGRYVLMGLAKEINAELGAVHLHYQYFPVRYHMAPVFTKEAILMRQPTAQPTPKATLTLPPGSKGYKATETPAKDASGTKDSEKVMREKTLNLK